MSYLSLDISHIMTPPDEIRRCAHYKFHILYSHITNDCNMFQSSINKCRLMLHEMQVDN
jgi:hypothetical protein